MMMLFLASILLICYVCAVFPLLLYVRGWLCPKPHQSGNETPSVSVIVAARNEAGHIGERIANLLASDYPRQQLEVIVASDGSTDDTEQVVAGYAREGVIGLSLPQQGKGLTLNAAAAVAQGEVLVFTDANVVFPPKTLRALVAPLCDPSVGGVAGNQIYVKSRGASPTADGERLYWDSDRFLKQCQSRAGSVTSATGSIYAIRRELYEPIPPNVMDDFFLSTGVVARGSRLVFAAQAIALEPVATKAGVEFRRKLRIIGQGLSGVWARRALLNPLRTGFYSVQLFTHKVLRRLLVLPLMALLVTSVLLSGSSLFFLLCAALQAGFYGLAAGGWLLRKTAWSRIRPLSVPYYLCLVNAAALIALVNLLLGRRIRGWEPERQSSPPALAVPRPLAQPE